MKRFIRRSVKIFWRAVATLVIALAVLIVIGRELAPYIDRFQPEIEAYLSDKLDADVRFSAISMKWERLSVSVSLNDLSIEKNIEGAIEPVLSVTDATADIDLLASVTEWRPAFKTLTMNDVKVGVVQNEQGDWNLNGYEFKRQSSPNFDPMEWFLKSPTVHLRNASIFTQFRAGQSTVVDVSQVTIENDYLQDFRRLTASIKVLGEPDQLDLIVEAKGDPRERTGFSAEGFLKLRHFSAERFLAMLPSKQFSQVDMIWDEPSSLDVNLWLSFPEPNVFDIQGDVVFSPGNILIHQHRLNLSTPASVNFSGQVGLENGFEMYLRDLHLQDQNYQFQLPELMLSSENYKQIKLTLANTNIDPIIEWLLQAETLPEVVSQKLAQVNPSGDIEYLSINVDFDDWQSSTLVAKVSQVALGDGHHIPRLKNLAGFFSGTVKSGSVVASADGFSIDIEPMYEQAMTAKRAEGQINWSIDIDHNQFVLYSNRLKAIDQFGEAFGYLYLDLPLKADLRPSTLTLAIGGKSIDVSYYTKFLPTKKIPRELADWMAQSIKGGLAKEVGVIYRGGFREDIETDKTFQVFVNLEQGHLNYSSDWPELTDVNGLLVLDNSEVNAHIKTAKTVGASVSDVNIFFPGQWRNQAKQVQIKGRAFANVAQGLDFVRQSILKNVVGELIDQWQGAGNVSAYVDLLIGLQGAKSKHNVAIDLNDVQLKWPSQELQVDAITGRINYALGRGLFAKGLTARVLGNSVKATISESNGVTNIDWEGSASIAQVNKQWPNPFLKLIHGTTAYQASLAIGKGPVKLSVSSDLENIYTDFPEPLLKPKNEIWPLKLDMELDRLYYDAVVNQNIRLGRDRQGDYFTVNQARPKSQAAPIYIGLDVQALNVSDWMGVISNSSSGDSEDTDVNILTKKLMINEHILTNVSLKSIHRGDQHELSISSDKLTGTLSKSVKRPWLLFLERLDWPLSDQIEQEMQDFIPEAFDHRQVPDMDVSIDKLFYQGNGLGQWSFIIRSQADALRVDQITANLPGNLVLSGVGEGQTFAQLEWLKSSDQSHLQFLISGGNLQPFLSAWEMENAIDNQKTEIIVDVFWKGQLNQFSLKKLKGKMAASLEKGQFLKTEGQSSTDFLRLLGLFNFDSWARRLRLDFSDLYKTGLAFDRVEGNFEFNQGIIFLKDSIDVKAPSSSFSMSGQIDMNQKLLDLKLKTTLPVTGNLTLVTALAAGLPTAASVYVLGKMFKKQVDKVSTIEYDITGPWSNPSMSGPPEKEPAVPNPYDAYGGN